VYATPPQLGVVPVFPSVPLTVIGYVDLTDRSAAGRAVVGITLVGTAGGAAPTTYADYTVGGPASGTRASTVSLAGFLTDGSTRLDLASSFTSTATEFSTHTTAAVAGQDVHMVETVSFSGTTTIALAIDFSLTSGGETVRSLGTFVVDTTARTAGGSFAVTVNDRAFATVNLGLRGASYSAAPGVTLDAADEAALDGLIGASFGLFALVLVMSIPGLVLGV
jgi:hypothetical protein